MIRLPNGEYSCAWKCPACKHVNKDSVSPVYGPFISCTCATCGRTSHDDQLDTVSVASLETARSAAENDRATLGAIADGEVA